MPTSAGSKAAPRGLKWLFVSANLYYALVALEFFYMASPFAAYFYGVYGPGLNWLSDSPAWGWLNTFFLPHIAMRTRSPLVDAHNLIGGVLFLLGMAAFVVGVVQIYRHKLLKREEVVGGLYAHVRHPQYLGLMTASLGMVLLWPRFLVLLGFVTMVFVYVWLARAEERLCHRKYPGYAAYAARTGMFLPRPLERLLSWWRWPASRAASFALGCLLYAGCLAAASAAGLAWRHHAIGALHAVYAPDAATIAVGDDSADRIQRMVDLARADPRVAGRLKAAGLGAGLRMINYVLPTGLYISEIPMVIPPGIRTGHTWPEGHDPDLYKVIFTSAQWPVALDGPPPLGIDIVKRAVNKHPVVEVHLDLGRGQVLAVHGPPHKAFYAGMPVPVY